MTLDETYQLLERIALVDDRIARTAPEEVTGQAEMWAVILRDVPPEFAATAVAEHYAASPHALRPADIATRWRAHTRARLADHTDPVPAADPDDEAAYRAALAANRHAVATGTTEPQRALSEDDVSALRAQGDLSEYIRQELARASDEREHRRRLVLRHPDLAARLTQPPLPYTSPEHWGGHLGADTWTGRPNTSPQRTALLEIVAEAEQRATEAATRPPHGRTDHQTTPRTTAA